MIDLGTGIGAALSLVLFLWDQHRGAKSSRDVLRKIDTDRTIRDYEEWLRRQSQDELIQRINANEDKLLRELGSLGTDIHGLFTCLTHELRESHDELIDRLKHLNARFAPPILSPVPLRSRPLTTVPLLARESELTWLQELVCDAVVYGQPGSGKTYLLYHFARHNSGRFVLTKDPDAAVSAVINGCPPILIVDDAADQRDLIQRLIHLRREKGLSFRLIATCWPFEWEEVSRTMELQKSATLELPLVSRAVIAELIQSVITDAGYHASNDIVREINNQARGRPGLAVALTQASLQEELRTVMSGETLAKKMERLFESIVGGKAAQIMAAFSVGGNAGMEMEVVSQAMEIPIVELHQALKNMAPGGVFEQLSGSRLMVTPRAMHGAILKDVFFKPDGIRLPQPVYETLMNAAPGRDAAVQALLESVAVGAKVDHVWLRSQVCGCRSAKVWGAYAWLGGDQCQYLIRNHPEMIPHIIYPALHYTPSLIIPRMFDGAANDNRPLSSHPDTSLRKLADWVSHAKVGTSDTVQRRRDLLAAIKAWFEGGGDRYMAFRALEPCFALGYRMTDTDPGDGLKVTISSGLLPLKDVDAITALWPVFLEFVGEHGIPYWKPLTSIISEWLDPRSRLGQPGGDEYRGKTLPVARRMIEDLVALCEGHNGFLRWAYIHAAEAELDPSTIPVSQEYLQLYPVERLSEDWKAENVKNARHAEELVDSWKDLAFKDIIMRLQRYESEAASMDHTWPRLSPYVCRLIAERRAVPEEDILALIESGVPRDLVNPFLVVASERGHTVDAALRDCANKDGYRHLVVYHTLMGTAPHLYPEISHLLPEYSEFMNDLAYGGSIAEEIMQSLLNHEDNRVRLSAALVEFRSEPNGQVRPSVTPAWRDAMVTGVATYEKMRDLRCIHDQDKIIAYDRTLAFDTLMAMASTPGLSLSMWNLEPIMPLLTVLNREERLRLLDACEDLMTEIPRVLIGDDTELYRQFLGRPEMRRHHLTPLIGSPSDAGWVDKALVALEIGYTPMDVASAVRGRGWSWSGKESAMWQNWIEAFQPLVEHENSLVQDVGKAGVEWSTSARNGALAEERHEDIYGRSDQ